MEATAPKISDALRARSRRQNFLHVTPRCEAMAGRADVTDTIPTHIMRACAGSSPSVYVLEHTVSAAALYVIAVTDESIDGALPSCGAMRKHPLRVCCGKQGTVQDLHEPNACAATPIVGASRR